MEINVLDILGGWILNARRIINPRWRAVHLSRHRAEEKS
jgi:hypothetical protein